MKKLSLPKGILIFYAFDAFLLLLLLLGLSLFNHKNVPEKIETALFTKDRISEIKSIEISANDQNGERQTVILVQDEDIWIGTDTASKKTYFWPAETLTIQNLLSEVTKIQPMYLAGSDVSTWKKLGVDANNSEGIISFLNDAGGTVSSIYVGKRDALTQRVPVRAWSGQEVYQADDSICTWITSSTAFWADPYIFPQCVTEYSREQSEKLLRHGLLENIAPASHIKPIRTVERKFENGSKAILSIYEKGDSYIVIPKFIASGNFSSIQKKAIESLNYRYSISRWTLDKIEE